MKSKEEIEKLAKEEYPSIIGTTQTGVGYDMNVREKKAYIKGYIQCQEDMADKWISVKDKLPDCWSQHRYDYGSGYLLGYTKYNEVEITQLWNTRQEDGTYKKHWEGDDDNEGDYITHWMPLPNKPLNKQD